MSLRNTQLALGAASGRAQVEENPPLKSSCFGGVWVFCYSPSGLGLRAAAWRLCVGVCGGAHGKARL